MELTVSSVVDKTTKNGKTYKLINGKYFLWDNIPVEINKVYDMEVDSSGQFPKVKSLRLLQTQPSTPAAAPAAARTDSRDDMMRLSYCKDIAIASYANTPDGLDKALKIARAVYIINGLLKAVNYGIKDYFKLLDELSVVEENFGVEAAGEVEEDNAGK